MKYLIFVFVFRYCINVTRLYYNNKQLKLHRKENVYYLFNKGDPCRYLLFVLNVIFTKEADQISFLYINSLSEKCP